MQIRLDSAYQITPKMVSNYFLTKCLHLLNFVKYFLNYSVEREISSKKVVERYTLLVLLLTYDLCFPPVISLSV